MKSIVVINGFIVSLELKNFFGNVDNENDIGDEEGWEIVYCGRKLYGINLWKGNKFFYDCVLSGKLDMKLNYLMLENFLNGVNCNFDVNEVYNGEDVGSEIILVLL